MEHNFKIEKFSDKLKEEYITLSEYPCIMSNYLDNHPEIQYLICGDSLGDIATTMEDLLQLKKEIDKILDGV